MANPRSAPPSQSAAPRLTLCLTWETVNQVKAPQRAPNHRAARRVPAHKPAARGQPSEGRHGMAHHGPALVLFWPVCKPRNRQGIGKR
jgi:hypothetical protein